MTRCWKCDKDIGSDPKTCAQCGSPVIIPHGTHASERRAYAGLVRKVSTTFYCADGVWGEKLNRANEPDVVLVEVWDAGNVLIHPSRYAFHWVTDSQQRKLWHALAVDPNVMRAFSSATHALAQRPPAHERMKEYQKPPLPESNQKSLQVPAWATESNVVGYTGAKPMRIAPGAMLATLGGTSLPSVYYRSGHATLDHYKRGNTGWEGDVGWKCLFFGNVPRRHIRS